MVEEALKTVDSKAIDDTKTKGVRSDREEDEKLEEGEIAGGDVDVDVDTLSSSSSRPGTDIVQHPSWTFWLDNPSAKAKQASWGNSICPIYLFSTVEEFWSLYNNIHRPSKLASRADFYCF
ncbi:putative translation Initiation factor eIF-4e [Helianthus anomalus]